jgi:hypothetical protein
MENTFDEITGSDEVARIPVSQGSTVGICACCKSSNSSVKSHPCPTPV